MGYSINFLLSLYSQREQVEKVFVPAFENLAFSSHFSQLPIFLSGILAGPLMGLITGAVGGIYMATTRIPFIIGGLAVLGCAAGFLGRRLKPVLAGVLAWLIQLPYVFFTDYTWFTTFLHMDPNVAMGVVWPIILILAIEAFVCAFLAQIVITYLRHVKLIIS